MSPIERYAMRFVEETGGSWTAEQLRAAEAEIEQQKREWEANRLAALRKAEDDERRAQEEENEVLTFSREDAKNQVNKKSLNRKPINRRLLNVKCGKNVNAGRNRRGKMMQLKSQIANESTRRVLRNSQRTLLPTRSARDVSGTTINKINDNRRANVKSAKSSSPKKGESGRIKRTRYVEPKMTVSSDDDEDNDDDNGGGENDDDDDADDADEVDDNDEEDNDTADEPQSNHSYKNGSDMESEAQRSDDFNDSECSLDVMVDSTDPTESGDSARTAYSSSADNDEEDAKEAENQKNEGVDNDYDRYSRRSNNLLNRSVNSSLDNHIEENSPRTRSHGRVKIDLWTLDKSQILPDQRAKRTRKRTVNASNIQNGAIDDQHSDDDGDDTVETDNPDQKNDSSEIYEQNYTTNRFGVENCDNSNVDSNKLKTIRTAKLPDGFQNNMSVSPNTVSRAKKCSKNEKPTGRDNGSSSSNSKNRNTLDSWILSTKYAKIILDRSECVLPTQATGKRKLSDCKRN